jgi:hypothetical protein
MGICISICPAKISMSSALMHEDFQSRPIPIKWRLPYFSQYFGQRNHIKMKIKNSLKGKRGKDTDKNVH